MGHEITDRGVKPDPKKIDALQKMPRPKNQKGVRSFLGFTNHYRRFIENYAEKAKVLTDLLKKPKSLIWGKEQEKAFEEMKDTICKKSTLAYPDMTKQFITATDASIEGLGAVLSQLDDEGNEIPISFASRTFLDAEQRYSKDELECLCVLWAIKHFKAYVYGREFIVYTSSSAIEWLRNTIEPTNRQKK